MVRFYLSRATVLVGIKSEQKVLLVIPWYLDPIIEVHSLLHCCFLHWSMVFSKIVGFMIFAVSLVVKFLLMSLLELVISVIPDTSGTILLLTTDTTARFRILL